MAASRGRKLDESITYQQFLAKIEEEEAWVSEKQQLLTVPDLGLFSFLKNPVVLGRIYKYTHFYHTGYKHLDCQSFGRGRVGADQPKLRTFLLSP